MRRHFISEESDVTQQFYGENWAAVNFSPAATGRETCFTTGPSESRQRTTAAWTGIGDTLTPGKWLTKLAQSPRRLRMGPLRLRNIVTALSIFQHLMSQRSLNRRNRSSRRMRMRLSVSSRALPTPIRLENLAIDPNSHSREARGRRVRPARFPRGTRIGCQIRRRPQRMAERGRAARRPVRKWRRKAIAAAGRDSARVAGAAQDFAALDLADRNASRLSRVNGFHRRTSSTIQRQIFTTRPFLADIVFGI